jgi:hypothetical protein
MVSELRYTASWSSNCKVGRGEPGYNDIGLYDTSPVKSNFLWYEFIRHS